MSKKLKAEIQGLFLDPMTGPIVMLTPEGKTNKSEQKLLIWIGPAELMAIGSEMVGMKPKRPMTHDLLKNAIASLNGRVEKIVITELTGEGTFIASIHVHQNGQVLQIDARPSDSIALALRAKAPIYAEESLFAQSMGGTMPGSASASGSSQDKRDETLRDRLRSISPEDFGNYQL